MLEGRGLWKGAMLEGRDCGGHGRGKGALLEGRDCEGHGRGKGAMLEGRDCGVTENLTCLLTIENEIERS